MLDPNDVNDRNLDVTFLSETWFTSDTPQSMLLDLAPSGDDLRKSVLFTQPADTLDAYMYVDQFNAVVEQLLDKVAPVRSRCRRPQKPISKWLSSEAIAAKRSRRRLERRWRTTGAEADRSEYRQACRKANQLINASRTTYYRQRINEAGSNYRLRWKIVNDLLHSHDTDSTRTDDENRHVH